MLTEDKWFYFNDGSSAKTLEGLRDKLETISYSEFYHHVNSSKNDFALWIRHVLERPDIADSLEKVDSIVETVELLTDYVNPTRANKHLGSVDDLQSHIEHDMLQIDHMREGEGPDLSDVKKDSSTDNTNTSKQLQENSQGTNSAAMVSKDADSFFTKQEQPLSKGAQPLLATQTTPKKLLEDAKKTGDARTQGKSSAVASSQTKPKLMTGTAHSHDVGRLIVKDFIVGMIFGLIIGLLLGRMLAFI